PVTPRRRSRSEGWPWKRAAASPKTLRGEPATTQGRPPASPLERGRPLRTGAALRRLRREPRAVRGDAGQGGEERTRVHRARIDCQRADLDPPCPLGQARVQAGEELGQIHGVLSTTDPPGGASVTRTRAPRRTIAPGRGNWAIARPLPRSSGSRALADRVR